MSSQESSERVVLSAAELKEKLVYLTPPHAPSLVSTVGVDGVYNIGAFEQTMVCSDWPPRIVLAITPETDTARNIRDVGEFVVAFPTPAMVDQTYAAGVALPPDESEFELTGLTATPSHVVRPPMIKECPVQFECTLYWAKEAGDHWLVVGSVESVSVRPEYMERDKVTRRCSLDTVYYASSGVFVLPGARLVASRDRLVEEYARKREAP